MITKLTMYKACSKLIIITHKMLGTDRKVKLFAVLNFTHKFHDKIER